MTDHPEASNKARAISRGADLVAAYASDPRGWDGFMTGAQVFGAVAPETDDGGDLVSIIKDAIADLLHLADHLRMNTNAVEKMARGHYPGEQGGDLDTAWREVPESQVEYVPAIASTDAVPITRGVLGLLVYAAGEHVDYREEWGDQESQHYVRGEQHDDDDDDPADEYGDTTREIRQAIEEADRAWQAIEEAERA